MVKKNTDDSKMVVRENKSSSDDYFESILHSYYSPLCNYALKIVGSVDIAEDLVQDLFLQLYEKNALVNVNDPERYLIKSVKFKCMDYHRSKSKRREVNFEDYMHEPTQTVSDLHEDEIEPLIHYFAAKLPEKTRMVFLLSRDSEMTYKEIAEELNISVKTVEGQMGRALRQLRTILKSQNYLSLILFL